MVTQNEVENLFQIALRQMNDRKSRSAFSQLLSDLCSSVLDPNVKIPAGHSKLRKPSRDELLGYLRLSFVNGQCVQKREIFKADVASQNVKAGMAECHVNIIRGLGSAWLESNLTLILNHLLTIAAEPKATQAGIKSLDIHYIM